MTTTATSYWCHGCTRFVRVRALQNLTCPHCRGGFLEQIDTSPTHHRDSDRSARRRRRQRGGTRFNPVIVLRGGAAAENEGNRYEFYYDHGDGLRPMPATISEFLMGSGFDRLLDQLTQIETNGNRPPAAKAAVESMPTIEISDGHVASESHCAVCMESFEVGSGAREMPCKHIYHPDCILPWLSMHNSCPVCRHELPTDGSEAGADEGAVGLTIWRLPGGGFAVGRFSGERVMPESYTGTGGGPRRSGGGFGRAFRNLFSTFRRGSRASSSSSIADGNGSMNRVSMLRRLGGGRSSNRSLVVGDINRV